MRSWKIATGSVVVALRQLLQAPPNFLAFRRIPRCTWNTSSIGSIHTLVCQVLVQPLHKYTHTKTKHTHDHHQSHLTCDFRRSKSASLKALEVKQGEEAAQEWSAIGAPREDVFPPIKRGGIHKRHVGNRWSWKVVDFFAEGEFGNPKISESGIIGQPHGEEKWDVCLCSSVPMLDYDLVLPARIFARLCAIFSQPRKKIK